MDRLSRRERVGQFWRRIRHPWRIEVDGLERLPAGAVVLAVNRAGASDHLNVASSLRRPATVVIQPDSGLRPPLRLRRTTWTTDLDSDDHPAAVLGRNQVLVVFPEGAQSDDGAVHKGHAEFAAAALTSLVPIVPAALVSLPGHAGGPPSFWSAPLQRVLPEPRHRLIVGEPIDVQRYADLGEPSATVDGLILRGLADLVMTQISQLAGARYADTYTTTSQGHRSGRHDESASRQPQAPQSRQPRAERRAAQEERRAAEADLARMLDEQDAARLEEAAEAARRHAQEAAQVDELVQLRRRVPGPNPGAKLPEQR